ncbi:hypothetical protein [Peterkaempfera griseoplana]|nr:hypothetical protein [Peterkaempfera griseoplana]
MIALQIIGYALLVLAILAGTLLFLMGGLRYRDRPASRPRGD